jgi:hypothetical protein
MRPRCPRIGWDVSPPLPGGARRVFWAGLTALHQPGPVASNVKAVAAGRQVGVSPTSGWLRALVTSQSTSPSPGACLKLDGNGTRAARNVAQRCEELTTGGLVAVVVKDSPQARFPQGRRRRFGGAGRRQVRIMPSRHGFRCVRSSRVGGAVRKVTWPASCGW